MQGVTTIPQGSRVQEDSKRPLSLWDKDIVWSAWKHAEIIRNRYGRNINDKYAVASSHIDDQNGWNESSRRYITEEPIFYNPGIFGWRTAPENSKQGSGPPMDTRLAGIATEELDAYIKQGVELYEKWQKIGMAAEQARLFLPSYGMYVRWRWTPSLAAVIHFLKERLEHDSQKEIQVFAGAVEQLVRPIFPATFKAVFDD